MARSTSALHRMAVSGNDENSSINESNQETPKKFNVRRLSTGSNKSSTVMMSSDQEMSFDSDASVSSTNSRRGRKMWTEAEEACLISGVEKHGQNWDVILKDKDYSFNDRALKDLRNKYRSLIQKESATSSPTVNTSSVNSIFDIRTVNEKVTQVFIGPDWSRAQWIESDKVEHFETLLADFEKKIAAKQKMINRISPARTPSRYISNLAINSAAKRTKNNNGESSQDENESTPLKKTKQQVNESLTSSPLSVRSNKSGRSIKSTGSIKKQEKQDEILLVHSDSECGEDEVVYPNEESEPKPQKNRCIIM